MGMAEWEGVLAHVWYQVNIEKSSHGYRLIVFWDTDMSQSASSLIVIGSMASQAKENIKIIWNSSHILLIRYADQFTLRHIVVNVNTIVFVKMINQILSKAYIVVNLDNNYPALVWTLHLAALTSWSVSLIQRREVSFMYKAFWLVLFSYIE